MNSQHPFKPFFWLQVLATTDMFSKKIPVHTRIVMWDALIKLLMSCLTLIKHCIRNSRNRYYICRAKVFIPTDLFFFFWSHYNQKLKLIIRQYLKL